MNVCLPATRLASGLLLAALLVRSVTVSADVPVFDRPQPAIFQDAELRSDGERRYANLLQTQEALGLIDQDGVLLHRARNVLNVLVGQVATLAPMFRSAMWEVHVTRSPDVDGLSMSGGKLLIGEAFVGRYELTEPELAMVLAHEMAHVLADHVGETFAAAYAVAYKMLPRQPFPSLVAVRGTLEADQSVKIQLGSLWRMQELEADSLGLLLAIRAGYRAEDLLGFFEKLARLDAGGEQDFAPTHPSAATRLLHVRAIKVLVEAKLL
jgi:Zn-dependent protease with chaperone function